MNFSKIATYGILTISGVAIGVTGVSSLQSHAESTSTNSTNSSLVDTNRRERKNNRAEFKANRQVVKIALTNKDYEAWKTAVAAKNTPRSTEMLKLIDTQEKFDKLVEGFNARKSGDKATAEKIATELGLPKRAEMGIKGINKSS